MLKFKGDLKELKKFEFMEGVSEHYDYQRTVQKMMKTTVHSIELDKDNREINLMSYNINTGIARNLKVIPKEYIKDLIQAGLVEKVEEG